MSKFLQLEPASTALVLIDLQHAIVSEPHLAPYPGVEVVSRAASLAAAFRRRGAPVVFSRVELAELLSLSADQPTRDPQPPPATASHLVPASGYDPNKGDLLVTKWQWGAFYGTALDQILRRRGVSTLVLGGIATNFGVESTARAALDRGYELVFVRDAMTGASAELHDFAVGKVFPHMGRVRGVDEVFAALSSP